MRAGYLGGLAAWAGFTLPSAIALVLFAYGEGALGGPMGIGLLHGLKLVAVAIVAQAVWGMARTLCPDRERASIAVVAALIILFSTSSIAQIAAILVGGIAGCGSAGRRLHHRRAYCRAGLAHRGARGFVGLLSSARRTSRAARPWTMAGRCPLRRFLPIGRAGFRGWSCGAAVAARGLCDSRLGER